MTPEELAERFDISISAARIRLEELEKMNRRRLGTKRELPQGILDFLRDAKKSGHTITSIDE